MLSATRPLDSWERDVLARLVARAFPDRPEILEQLAEVHVRPLDPEGSIEFLHSGRPSLGAPTSIPVEAEAEDADGVTIHILLHLRNGTVSELEVFKEDSSPVLKRPPPGDLVISEG